MGLSDLMGGVKALAAKKLIAALMDKFPGLTLEALREGWLPVSFKLIGQQALPPLREIFPQIETVKLRSIGREDAFNVAIDLVAINLSPISAVLWPLEAKAKSRVTANIRIEPFSIESRKTSIVFVCEGDVDVSGRNMLGRLLGIFVEKTLMGALTKTSAAGEETESAVTLNWPRITVNVDKLPKVGEALDYSIMDKRITDILTLGPVRVHDAQIDVRFKKGEFLESMLRLLAPSAAG